LNSHRKRSVAVSDPEKSLFNIQWFNDKFYLLKEMKLTYSNLICERWISCGHPPLI